MFGRFLVSNLIYLKLSTPKSLYAKSPISHIKTHNSSYLDIFIQLPRHICPPSKRLTHGLAQCRWCIAYTSPQPPPSKTNPNLDVVNDFLPPTSTSLERSTRRFHEGALFSPFSQAGDCLCMRYSFWPPIQCLKQRNPLKARI